MLPTFIRSTPEFQSAVQLGSTPESLVLEFKETVNDWNPPAGDPQRKNGLCPVTIPYGLVEEAWVGVFGAVTLLLRVRVIMLENDNLVTLESYGRE